MSRRSGLSVSWYCWYVKGRTLWHEWQEPMRSKDSAEDVCRLKKNGYTLMGLNYRWEDTMRTWTCFRGKTEHASAQIRTELVIPISLRLVVYWYHWFKTAAAWYSHVILDCIEPGAHWEGLQAMIMQQQDLISCPLDLSSPSVISTHTLSTFILQPEYLHRFSQSSTHMRLSIFHRLLENSDFIWPAKNQWLSKWSYPTPSR